MAIPSSSAARIKAIDPMIDPIIDPLASCLAKQIFPT